MSEQPPRPENMEFSEEERAVIEALRNVLEGEFVGSQAQEALVAFLEEQEKANAVFTSSLVNIKDQLKLGKIYYAAGYKEAALETLKSLLEVSEPDGQEIYDEAISIIEKLENDN